MEIAYLTKFILAFLFIISLICLLAFLLRKLDFVRDRIKTNLNKRINLVETIIIDPHNKIILVKRDSIEHLILVNRQTSIYLEKISKQDQ